MIGASSKACRVSAQQALTYFQAPIAFTGSGSDLKEEYRNERIVAQTPRSTERQRTKSEK
jgi:hypothetical protein